MLGRAGLMNWTTVILRFFSFQILGYFCFYAAYLFPFLGGMGGNLLHILLTRTDSVLGLNT